MQLICSFAGTYMNMTVGKAYETLYVEKKTFLDYGIPYVELIDDSGEAIGWAPCDMEALRFVKYPTVEDAHGIEGRVPVDRLNELNAFNRALYTDDGVLKPLQEVDRIVGEWDE